MRAFQAIALVSTLVAFVAASPVPEAESKAANAALRTLQKRGCATQPNGDVGVNECPSCPNGDYPYCACIYVYVPQDEPPEYYYECVNNDNCNQC